MLKECEGCNMLYTSFFDNSDFCEDCQEDLFLQGELFDRLETFEKEEILEIIRLTIKHNNDLDLHSKINDQLDQMLEKKNETGSLSDELPF
jgi:hypothetical protein